MGVEDHQLAVDPPGRWAGYTRIDAHCHSSASDAPVIGALEFLGVPECYSEPEQVYDQARGRGMDLVTITDHDTVKGALTLQERAFQGFIVGEEVTTYFPEDHCKIHVLVWGLTGDQHEEIASLGLRDDIYQFAQWVHERDLCHAVAHPVYVQNRRLNLWHLERLALLFRGFEALNGAHSSAHVAATERLLEWLTPKRVEELSQRHELKPVWPDAWRKGRTAGSDDHGLLNVGRAFTAIRHPGGDAVTDPEEFFRIAMGGGSEVGGVPGHSALLAHQMTTVAAHWAAERMKDEDDVGRRYLGNKMLRFAGADLPKPSKLELGWHEAKRRMLLGKRGRKRLPITKALRKHLRPVLNEYPDLKSRLDPERWVRDGSALSSHDEMAEFFDDLIQTLSKAMGSGAIDALRKRDKVGIVDHLMSYTMITAAQVPYIFSLFYQNKERELVEQLNHRLGTPGTGASPLERPMKVSLFTDTLGDINGVCRFIQNVAEHANNTDRDLEVITSTTFDVPDWDNIYNFEPSFAAKIPKYENLDMVLPPVLRILRHVDRHQPDVIHISTPGPVGLVGYLAAKMLRVPVLGVYHTDFPAYIDHLFDDDSMTWATQKFMRWFYKPFWAIFTRSEDYVDALERLGMDRDRCVSLMPGVDTELFHTKYKDEGVWERIGVEARAKANAEPTDNARQSQQSTDIDVRSLEDIDKDSVKVLFVGRVSVEKNMPLLNTVWKLVHAKCVDRGLNAELIIVGDGPYRAQMQEELAGMRARFLGFRHGEELSTLYASCDLFAFPSTTDTLGQVVMEAQGSGSPVIVTDEGGPQEVVEEGVTGFVIPADQPEQWAERIVELVADNDRRRQMGATAHEKMQGMNLRASFEHFWEVHVDAWHKHLHQLGIDPIDGGKGGAPVHAEPKAEPAGSPG